MYQYPDYLEILRKQVVKNKAKNSKVFRKSQTVTMHWQVFFQLLKLKTWNLPSQQYRHKFDTPKINIVFLTENGSLE